MKKLNYLLLPLLAIPFIASCGAKCEKVTEEVFNDAIINKNVEYLQIKENVSISEEGGMMNVNADGKLSPTTYHMKGTSEENMEIYSKISNDKTTVTAAVKIGKEWMKEQTMDYEEAIEAGCWGIPSMASASYLAYGAGSEDISFKDFEYKSSGYYAELKTREENDVEGPNLNKITIFFANKKVSKVTLVSVYRDPNTKQEQTFVKEKVSYSYKEETPKDPR